MNEGLTANLPEDFYDYITQEEKESPIENRLRLYYLRKATGENLKDKAILEAKIKLGECYKEIKHLLKEYIDTSEENYTLISLWILGTYFHGEFATYPFLFFNAMKGSAKTRTLKLISALGSKGNGFVQNSITEAGLFRIPKGTTTCIDECEQVGSKEKQTLRELLNSAYKKGTQIKRMKKVKSKEGENQVSETFEPYIPIALANIWGLDEVLSDRSITLILERSDNPFFTKKIEDFDTNPRFIELKRTLERISVVCVVKLRSKTYIQHWNEYINMKYKYTNIIYITNNTNYINNTISATELLNEQTSLFNKIDESEISGRNFELFFPLILVAQELGEEEFNAFLPIAKKIVSDKKGEDSFESKDSSLYEFVALHCISLEEYPIKTITMKFREFLGEEHGQDSWLNEKWIGKALKRLNLVSGKKRMNTGIIVTLDIGKAKEKLKIFKDILKGER